MSSTEEIKKQALSINLNETDKDFANKLYKDSNAIAFKT